MEGTVTSAMRETWRTIISVMVGAAIGGFGTAYVYASTVDKKLTVLETKLDGVVTWERQYEARTDNRLLFLEHPKGVVANEIP